jgi:hypothetical protein
MIFKNDLSLGRRHTRGTMMLMLAVVFSAHSLLSDTVAIERNTSWQPTKMMRKSNS